jgi:hypothetical protein
VSLSCKAHPIISTSRTCINRDTIPYSISISSSSSPSPLSITLGRWRSGVQPSRTSNLPPTFPITKPPFITQIIFHKSSLSESQKSASTSSEILSEEVKRHDAHPHTRTQPHCTKTHSQTLKPHPFATNTMTGLKPTPNSSRHLTISFPITSSTQLPHRFKACILSLHYSDIEFRCILWLISDSDYNCALEFIGTQIIYGVLVGRKGGKGVGLDLYRLDAFYYKHQNPKNQLMHELTNAEAPLCINQSSNSHVKAQISTLEDQPLKPSFSVPSYAH